MKFVIGAISGIAFVAAFVVVINFVAPKPPKPPKLPEVLASSISPDSKWICEIVDIDPHDAVCEILIHGQEYRGRSNADGDIKPDVL